MVLVTAHSAHLPISSRTCLRQSRLWLVPSAVCQGPLRYPEENHTVARGQSHRSSSWNRAPTCQWQWSKGKLQETHRFEQQPPTFWILGTIESESCVKRESLSHKNIQVQERYHWFLRDSIISEYMYVYIIYYDTSIYIIFYNIIYNNIIQSYYTILYYNIIYIIYSKCICTTLW